MESDVSLCIDWFDRNEQTRSTEEAVGKMDNGQRQEFAKSLLASIIATRYNEADKKEEAKGKLTSLFGDEVLGHAAVTRSRDGFFFSLTGDGTEFRAWYALFWTVTRQHFDSCGTGCVFSAYCRNPEVLKEWLAPFVDRMVEWKSDYFGCLWMGDGRRY